VLRVLRVLGLEEPTLRASRRRTARVIAACGARAIV
jgi:hypothetical protein